MLHIVQRSEAFLLRRRYAVTKGAGRIGAHEDDERSEQNPAYGRDLARERRKQRAVVPITPRPAGALARFRVALSAVRAIYLT